MNVLRVVPACVLLAGLLTVSAHGADKIRVVTTTTDLKALTEAVGGGLVEVDALARGNQNPHDLEVRPSLMVKVRRADVLVLNGLELDQWADVVVQGANNPKVIPGAPRRVDASAGVLVLEIPTTRVDRSMGDVHPVGNPHYSLDPGLAPAVTANILEGLVRVAPEYRAMFERNRAEFLGRLEPALRGWSATLAPFKGAPVVVYHAQWAYLLARFGLTQVGTVEERPGIPPAPGHIAKLIQLMKDEKVKVIIVEPWSDYKLAERVAQEAGGQVVLLATGVGAVKGAETYLDAVDYNVKTLAKALK
jgi:zinc/manganese transport system substrate-binding protein